MTSLIHGINIKSVQTSTHAATVERYIRTLKDDVYRRLYYLNQDKNNWLFHINNIINKYNDTEHIITPIKLTKLVRNKTICV